MNHIPYIAGIIDGEGTLRVQHMKSKSPTQYVPMIRITSVTREVLDFVQKYYGGWIRDYQPRSSKGKENCRLAYEWTLQGRSKVLAMIRDIEPFCITKRAHIKLMAQFITEDISLPPPTPVPMEEVARRQIIFEQFRMLNHRGIHQEIAA